MFLLHPSDGCLLADRGSAPAYDLDDPHGVAAHAGNHVNRRGRHQLSQLHQLHVLRRPHHGHRCGAQWPSQQVTSTLLLADSFLIEISFRIALRIIMMVGTSQARLMLGFMITTMFLSMWIV